MSDAEARRKYAVGIGAMAILLASAFGYASPRHEVLAILFIYLTLLGYLVIQARL